MHHSSSADHIRYLEIILDSFLTFMNFESKSDHLTSPALSSSKIYLESTHLCPSSPLSPRWLQEPPNHPQLLLWGYRLQAGTFSCFPLNSSASGKMHGPQAPEQCPPKQHQDRSPSHPQGVPGGLHSPTLDRGQQTAKQVGAGVRGQWKSKGESKPSSSEMQILMWLLRTGQWKIKAGTRVKLGSLPTRSLPDLASRLVFFLLLAERNPIRVCVEPPKGKAFGCSWPTWEVGGQRRSCSFWKQIQSLW